MRLPCCRSAWPSIHAPMASRSWLEVSFMAMRMSACESTSLCTTAGRWAAADDFLDVAEQAFPAFDRTLRRPQIGFVENEVERFLVAFVEGLGKRRHKAAARRCSRAR